MEIPKLKSSFHCEVVGSDLVFLLNESRYWVLSGKLYANLLPLIDGKRNFEQIALDAGGTYGSVVNGPAIVGLSPVSPEPPQKKDAT